ncbi:MAG: hypothetical protein ABR988_12015 [Terriglobales bacterium]|jgi:hypothetical protein
MNKVCLEITLAVAVLLASSRLGFALPQNGLATNGLAMGAGAESPPAPATSSYPDAPSAVKPAGAPGVPEMGAEQAGFRAPAPAATGGLSRAIDGKYMVAMSAMFASSIVNVEETNSCLEQHTCSFVPMAFRSRGALYGAGIPAELGVAYLSYKLKEHRHRWWFVPAMVVTGGNSFVAYHSATENSSPRTSK